MYSHISACPDAREKAPLDETDRAKIAEFADTVNQLWVPLPDGSLVRLPSMPGLDSK